MLDRLSIAASIRRHRHVLDDEARESLKGRIRGHGRVDERQERVTELRIARGHIEHGDLRGGDGVGEDADDARAHRIAELVQPEVVVRSRHFAQERLRLDDAEVVGAERAHAHDAEVGVAEHEGIGGPPLVAREQARDDVVDVGLEGRVEAVGPRLDPREDRDVVGGQRVLARPERVAELGRY
ncbi:MAG: hypothetical protein R2712_14520 [Vicinamibacterales bacterium]